MLQAGHTAHRVAELGGQHDVLWIMQGRHPRVTRPTTPAVVEAPGTDEPTPALESLPVEIAAPVAADAAPAEAAPVVSASRCCVLS